MTDLFTSGHSLQYFVGRCELGVVHGCELPENSELLEEMNSTSVPMLCSAKPLKRPDRDHGPAADDEISVGPHVLLSPAGEFNVNDSVTCLSDGSPAASSPNTRGCSPRGSLVLGGNPSDVERPTCTRRLNSGQKPAAAALPSGGFVVLRVRSTLFFSVLSFPSVLRSDGVPSV